MFTGIVEELGKINSITIHGSSGQLSIKAKTVLEGTKIGDSIAVNGVCLTVTSLSSDGFTADIMAETVRRSSFGKSRPGDSVNLERAMAADGRFGGHIVAGHVDDTGVISSLEKEENALWITITTSPAVLKYIIEKGSIAIDGVSLTVAYVDNTCFKVSIIPHTIDKTALHSKRIGDIVNLENDMVGKYVEKLLLFGNAENVPNQTSKSSTLTMEMLQKYDF